MNSSLNPVLYPGAFSVDSFGNMTTTVAGSAGSVFHVGGVKGYAHLTPLTAEERLESVIIEPILAKELHRLGPKRSALLRAAYPTFSYNKGAKWCYLSKFPVDWNESVVLIDADGQELTEYAYATLREGTAQEQTVLLFAEKPATPLEMAYLYKRPPIINWQQDVINTTGGTLPNTTPPGLTGTFCPYTSIANTTGGTVDLIGTVPVPGTGQALNIVIPDAIPTNFSVTLQAGEGVTCQTTYTS